MKIANIPVTHGQRNTKILIVTEMFAVVLESRISIDAGGVQIVCMYEIYEQDLFRRSSLPELFRNGVLVINLVEEISWRDIKSKRLVGAKLLGHIQNHVGILINAKTIPL